MKVEAIYQSLVARRSTERIEMFKMSRPTRVRLDVKKLGGIVLTILESRVRLPAALMNAMIVRRSRIR
jgi:hypothetical protein